MNYLGYNKDNFVEGDSGIDNGTLRINDYILPSEKGTEGQVLTMNADNSTSFQDAAGGGDNVLGVGNGADITIPYAPSSAPVVNVIPPSFIGTRRVNIKDIAVGGSVHFYVNSRYNLQIPSAGSTDTYTNILFFVTGYRADNTSVGAAVPTIRNNNYFSGAISVPADLVGYLKVEGVITRTATDTFKATVIAFNRRYADTLNPCQIWENVSSIEEINFPAPQDDDYIQWQLQFFNSYYSTGTFVLTNPSVYWTLKNVSTAITPPVSTSDHTQLTNLNLGDAGHTQFALLQGRSGGQVLSGGITPANFLTLKSHTAGLNNIVIKDLNTTFEKNIDMSSNNIINVSEVNNTSNLKLSSVGGSLDIDSNLIQFISTAVPQGQIDAVGGWEIFNALSMTNNNINNVNTLQANQVNTDTIENSGSGFLSFTNLGGAVIPSFTSTGLDLNLGEVANVANIKNSSVLNINQGGASATNIYGNGGFKVQISNAVYIINGVILNIHDKIIYVPPNQMPTSFIADYTYIFVNNRTTANSYTLPANCKIMGTGKNNSTINYTGAGSLFTTTDNNLSISDITLTSSNNAGILLTASNVAKNKTINFTGLQIRNSKNGMDITGYDLIDFNNCIFTYFESGSASPIGVKITDASKVQLSSTEFLRWFQEGGTPATTFFNGNMLEFVNVLNALNINGSFFHPQFDQNGIDLNAVSSVIEGTITSNTFIDINLNTPTFNVLNIPTAISTNYVIEGNSIYPNLRSQVTYVLSATNTTQTDLSVNNPNTLNTGGLAIGLVTQFATLTTGGLITYLKKRSANFIITASANLEVVAGGAGQQVGLGLRVNGVDIPLAYSYVTLDSAGTAPKQCTLNFTGLANQNDTFELTIFNASGNNNVIASYVNFAGIEI